MGRTPQRSVILLASLGGVCGVDRERALRALSRLERFGFTIKTQEFGAAGNRIETPEIVVIEPGIRSRYIGVEKIEAFVTGRTTLTVG